MTEPDKSRLQLTIAQLNAIDALVLGKSDREAAEAASVSRQTIWQWRNHHPEFKATLNRRRAAIFGAASDRLRALLPAALDALEREMQEGRQGWRAALEIVRIANLSVGKPGETSADAIIEAHARDRRPHQLETVLDQLNGEGPVTEEEKRAALREMLHRADGR